MYATPLFLLTLLAQLSQPVTDDMEAKARAKSLLVEGSRLYQDGAYADALAKFNAAYSAHASPKLMFNIGQANRALGRPVEALEAFESFLRDSRDSNDSSAKGIADARQSVAELQGKLGRITIHCDTPDAEVSLDGKNVGRCPLTGPIWAIPGAHQVTASKAELAPALAKVEVSEGATSAANLSLHSPALNLRLRFPPPRPSTPLRTVGWSATGLGLAGIGVGIVTGLVAWSEKTELERRCPGYQCTPENHSARAHYNNLRLASTIGFVAGGACLVTGVILLLVAPSGEQPPDARVAFGIGPRSAQVRIRF